MEYPNVDSCPFLARVLILVSKMSATAMMYGPIQLIDGLFQLLTFRGAGNVYSKFQATKQLYKQHN